MKAARHIFAITTALALGMASTLVSGDEAPAPSPEPAAPQSAAPSAMDQLSQASQAVYSKIAGSLIHVRIDLSYTALLNGQQRKEFMEWVRSQNAEGPSADPGAKDSAATQQSPPPPPPPPPLTPREQRRQARNGLMQADVSPSADASHATVAPPRASLAAMFRKYIDVKLKDPATDPVLVAKLRQAAARLQQPAGEMLGVVIDDQGDAIVLGGWVRDGAPALLKVSNSDNGETTARYLGGHPARGIAVIKLESPGTSAPLAIAHGAPAPGELLLCMTSSTGGAGWIVAPARNGKKAGEEERFAVFGGEDRGATYLFNTKGELAAVGFERYALPMDVLRNDVDWIIAHHKDVAPRQLGVKYSPVTSSLRKRLRILANRPAVVVEDVAAGSPAERAGLKKNDVIITIDRRPIWQMTQIQWDLATQTDPVPIGIVRDDHEMTLDMPLSEKE